VTDTQDPTTTTILTWATELATELEAALDFTRPVSSIVVVEVNELHYLAILDGSYSWLACADQCQDWLEDYRQWEPEDQFTDDDRAAGHHEYANFCDVVDHIEDTDTLLAASDELGIPLNGWLGNIDATTPETLEDFRVEASYMSRLVGVSRAALTDITCEICGDMCSRCATFDQAPRVRRWAKRWSERAAEGYVRLEVARLYGRRCENVLLTRHTLRCQANGFWSGWLAGRS
jgi:hypothetical protein